MTGALTLDRGDCVQQDESRGSWYAVIRLNDATVDCWNHASANKVVDVISDFLDALKVSMGNSSKFSKTRTYPISHRASSIVTSKQFCAFPFEGEYRVKDFPVPIWHISQAIHPSHHHILSHSIAECTVKVVSSEIGGQQTTSSTWGAAYGFSLPSRAEPNKVSLSHVISGWNGLIFICGHCKGRPKPGTIQPCCFRVAMLSKELRSSGDGVVHDRNVLQS